ncbi:FAD-binding oxidoreductase [Rhodococcus sp. ABRD24]|uniref:NAD(P)/FAD-dependent oxidoreductase n=1 Tax=Rhodococcus sp. ABRD24 TaxID=2507582 RepID=UPI00103BFA65|nr:FAD-binding oxidoreductase [Rhodococcus sp. ABRD24]QBJ96008.1 FAD-binding oxidoreductase [Rhodococcus sp. ABRD24]
MANTPAVIIVGAGVSGLSTALELVDAGLTNVTVLERRHPGEGSSGLSVGMVETQYFDVGDIETRVYGRRFFDRMSTDHGLGFVHGGYLRLAASDSDIRDFEASVTAQADYGVDDSFVLTADEITRRWPRIVMTDRLGGLFGSTDGYIDGYEFCTLAAGLISAKGGLVVNNAELLSATKGSGQWQLDTTRGTFRADVVVNAAGPWAGVVGDLLGAPVPLNPQLHGAVTIDLGRDADTLLPFVMDYVPNSGTDGIYFRSERPDQLIAGLHTDEDIHEPVSPDIPLGKVSHHFLERLSELMDERLRLPEDVGISGSWQGIYPMSPDHRPIVGAHPDAPSVVCALGAGGSGIQLAPAVGRLAAESILQCPTAFSDAVNWSPSRFSHVTDLVTAL